MSAFPAASQSLYWPNWSVVDDGIGDDGDLVAGVLLELVEYLAKNLQAVAGVARYDRHFGGLRRTGRQNGAGGKRNNCVTKLHG